MIHRLIFTLFFACVLLAGGGEAIAEASNPAAPLRVLIDVRSNHSDGAHDFSTLVELAKKRGIDVLAFTEHDRYSIRLGLEPIPQIIGYAMQHPSLYVTGVDEFFADLATIREQHPEMVFMAGTESTPGYTWTGIPFHDLTLVNAERHIIALGAEKSEQIEALPSFDLRHAHGPFTLSMIVWWVVAGTLFIVLIRKRQEIIAVLVFVLFIVLMATWLTREDVDIDVDFITKAEEQGLYTIFTHPGTLSGIRPGPFGLQLDTPPYSKRTFFDPTSQAFAAVYGDTDVNTVPGGLWDSYLIEYMGGVHASPIWATSCGDFHKEAQWGEYLGNFPMDVWAEEKSPEGVLKALRAGRAVAWRAPVGRDFRVRTLYLQDDATGQRVLPGGAATISSETMLHFAVDVMPHGKPDAKALLKNPMQARLIIDGRVERVLSFHLNTPVQSTILLSPGPHVVRLDIPEQSGIKMIANPFLVDVN